jgi:hypothetical protein
VSKRKTRMCENIMLMNNEHKYRVATLSPVLMGWELGILYTGMIYCGEDIGYS